MAENSINTQPTANQISSELNFDMEYQRTIEEQRSHLIALQENFNRKCDEAKERSKKKLDSIPEEDREAKEAVLKEQKTELEKALHDLKLEVDHSTRRTMKKLEEIIHKKEANMLTQLEEQLAKL